MPRLSAALTLALTVALPAWGQEANLSATPGRAEQGTAARLVVAQRAYLHALRSGEVLPLLASIRLARSVTLRPASGWEPVAEAAAEPLAATPAGIPDPAGDHAITIARNLAGDDPDLQDIVYDLDAQLPRGRVETAVTVTGVLDTGQSASWRIALFGEVQAELAVIGDGQAQLGLTLTDEGGVQVCAVVPTADPALCRLTPAQNGFFTLTIVNASAMPAAYRLFGN